MRAKLRCCVPTVAEQSSRVITSQAVRSITAIWLCLLEINSASANWCLHQTPNVCLYLNSGGSWSIIYLGAAGSAGGFRAVLFLRPERRSQTEFNQPGKKTAIFSDQRAWALCWNTIAMIFFSPFQLCCGPTFTYHQERPNKKNFLQREIARNVHILLQGNA